VRSDWSKIQVGPIQKVQYKAKAPQKCRRGPAKDQLDSSVLDKGKQQGNPQAPDSCLGQGVDPAMSFRSRSKVWPIGLICGGSKAPKLCTPEMLLLVASRTGSF
jgi:hypothetical protein